MNCGDGGTEEWNYKRFLSVPKGSLKTEWFENFHFLHLEPLSALFLYRLVSINKTHSSLRTARYLVDISFVLWTTQFGPFGLLLYRFKLISWAVELNWFRAALGIRSVVSPFHNMHWKRCGATYFRPLSKDPIAADNYWFFCKKPAVQWQRSSDDERWECAGATQRLRIVFFFFFF